MNTARKSFMFVINSLTSGGAERVAVDILNGLRSNLQQYDVHLVLLDAEPHRHAPPGWVALHCLDARFSVFRSAARLTRTIRALRPEIVVSFLTRANLATVVAGRLTGTPCIISERVHTTAHFGHGVRARAKRSLVRLSYPFADHVVAVSGAIRDDLTRHYGVDPSRVSVVYNPVDVDRIRARSLQPPSVGVAPDDVVAVGRLTANKNFPLLIEAFARSGLPGNLVIVGEGELRDDLLGCARRWGIAERFHLPGYVDNPFPLLRRARLFASSSLAEGFPNAIVEALAVGCPVVAADCPSGPREILQVDAASAGLSVGACGIVVPANDAAAMAEALRLASDTVVTGPLVQRGVRRASEFSVPAAVDGYWSVIEHALQQRMVGGPGLDSSCAA